jgi:hypothetical protein
MAAKAAVLLFADLALRGGAGRPPCRDQHEGDGEDLPQWESPTLIAET